MNAFWRLVEGNWARNLANNLSMPKERKAQHKLDYERLFTVCRLRELMVASPQAPVNYQRLLMEVRPICTHASNHCMHA